MRWRIILGVLSVGALLVVGCGDDSEEGAESASTTVEESTTTADEAEEADVDGDSMETQRVSSTWDTPAGEAWPLDVIAPVEPAEGGWPVLVTFHGTQGGTSANELASVAKSGVVVVGPRWIDPSWNFGNQGDPSDYVDGSPFDVAKCALAAAQAAAVDHGGDPDRTIVEGFSAGVHPAAWVGLGVVRNDPCPDAPVVAPVGVVFGDSQWLFQHERWDPDFTGASTQALDTVARFLEADRWTTPDGFVAYLYSTESTGESRAVGDPPAPDSWVHSRGDVVDDLDLVGAFDDELIDFDDNGELQAVRMEQAGLTVTHEQHPGGHRRHPAAIDRMIEIAHEVTPVG